MLISEKQHQSNLQNAAASTGPQTPEGKEAVKFNALKYGLRARSVFLPCEDPEEFDQLFEDLMSEWQPANRTEKHYVEQMVTAHWLLSRLASGEQRIYSEPSLNFATQLDYLDRISRQRARLEQSFTAAIHELQRLQKERKAAESESKSQTRKPPQRAVYPDPLPAEPPALVCVSTDSR